MEVFVVVAVSEYRASATLISNSIISSVAAASEDAKNTERECIPKPWFEREEKG